MSDDRAEKIAARFKTAFTSEASTLMVIKDASLAILQRDGSADWPRVEARLIEMRDAMDGDIGRARLEAAIAHLKKLVAKRA